MTIDDALYERADTEMDKTDLFRDAVKTFVRVQAGKRLAALRASARGMENAVRHRQAPGA